MSVILRKTDVIAFFGGNRAAVARDFEPAISRIAVRNWPDPIPELRARQLLERHPDLKEFVVDPETGLTLKEMRERLTG